MLCVALSAAMCVFDLQSNFNGSKTFGTMKICTTEG